MLRRLIEFCVRKRLPVLAVTLAIAAYGVKAYLDLPVEAFPDVTNLQVQVIAQLPGLAPEEIERQVTVPIERVLNGTPDMLQMRSESLFGLSLVSLTFDDGADPFKSRALVNEKMQEADLPDDQRQGDYRDLSTAGVCSCGSEFTELGTRRPATMLRVSNALRSFGNARIRKIAA